MLLNVIYLIEDLFFPVICEVLLSILFHLSFGKGTGNLTDIKSCLRQCIGGKNNKILFESDVPKRILVTCSVRAKEWASFFYLCHFA